MSLLFHKINAFIILAVAGVVGTISLLFFLFFLYTGAPGWVKLDLSESGHHVINGVLSFSFFLQHSGMIRRSFGKSLSSLLPAYYQGAVYTLASGIVLIVLVSFWQNSGTILFEAVGPFRYFLRALFFLSMLGMLRGLWALRPIDMFGLNPILRNIRATPIQKTSFIIQGPYRWVRHPLYLFMIVQFWSCPKLTTDRLFFNILWTIWVVGATFLEERDLTDDFGDAYRNYQAEVPMLIPGINGKTTVARFIKKAFGKPCD